MNPFDFTDTLAFFLYKLYSYISATGKGRQIAQ